MQSPASYISVVLRGSCCGWGSAGPAKVPWIRALGSTWRWEGQCWEKLVQDLVLAADKGEAGKDSQWCLNLPCGTWCQTQKANGKSCRNRSEKRKVRRKQLTCFWLCVQGSGVALGHCSPPCLLYFCSIVGMPKNQRPVVLSSSCVFQIPALPLRI